MFLIDDQQIESLKRKDQAPGCSKVGERSPPDKSLSNSISTGETNWTIHWTEIYPVDSAIHPLNNRGLCEKRSS